MSREAMKQALDALGYVMSHGAQVQIAKDILTEAIEQAEKQEPVAWMTHTDDLIPLFHKTRASALNWQTQPTPLYTAPLKHDYVIDCPRCGHCCPERIWSGLTDEEIQDLSHLSQKIDASNSVWFDRWGFARAIEAKLQEKNR